jgi:hypothetical protein
LVPIIKELRAIALAWSIVIKNMQKWKGTQT